MTPTSTLDARGGDFIDFTAVAQHVERRKDMRAMRFPRYVAMARILLPPFRFLCHYSIYVYYSCAALRDGHRRAN